MIRNDKLREIGKDICRPEKILREYEYLCNLEKIIDCKEFYAEVDGDRFEPLSVLTYDSIEKIRNIIRDEYNSKVDVLYDYVYGENVDNENVGNKNIDRGNGTCYDGKWFQKRFNLTPMELMYVGLSDEQSATCPFCGNPNVLLGHRGTVPPSVQFCCANCGSSTFWYEQPIKGQEIVWMRDSGK